MSQANVDRLRELDEPWNRGDLETVAALLRDLLAPDFEMHPLYLAQVYKGVDGLRDMWAEARETWGEEYRFELEEILDLDDHALVVGRILGRGVSSGVPVNQPLAMLCSFQDEKLVHAKSFTSKDEALEAASVRDG
jgi:ketosteroid isomerase-like protein